MKLKIKDRVEINTEIEIDFPVFRRHFLDIQGHTLYTWLYINNQGGDWSGFSIGENELGYNVSVIQPRHQLSVDELLGRGEYEIITKEDFIEEGLASIRGILARAELDLGVKGEAE